MNFIASLMGNGAGRIRARRRMRPRAGGSCFWLRVGLAGWLSVGSLPARDTLDLTGEWRLRLDPGDAGITANWPATPIANSDRITLPNTTDLAGFGFALDTNTMLHAAPYPVTTRFPGVKEPVRADEHGYLVRRHLFVGAAWYEREVEIPVAWRERPVTLRLERALWRTEVWVDGRRAGECDSLVAEHRYELGVLAPGWHRLTLRVDNRMIHNLSTITHAYGPETQSRWNGLVGALVLQASPPVSIRSLRVFPAADRHSVRVVARVANTTDKPVLEPARFLLFPERVEVALAQAAAALSCPPGLSTHEITLRLAEPAAAWDEFHPVRYRLKVELGERAASTEAATVTFGFRHLERVGRQLLLNGRPIYLRGTLDCAVYPRTGHPPMAVDEWLRILGVVKEYGFNHVRFHTWCPPEAAFEAADRLGVYLQPETAAWVDDWGIQTATKPPAIGRDPGVTEFLRAELHRMSEAYGNHPSFLLCAIGNEFGNQSTDWDRVNELVDEIKILDPRRLYTACGARKHLPADDFWFTHHTSASTRGVGPAHTDWDFANALAASPVPVIAHETGQRPVFPDYDALLPKFTGPLLPLNLERYRRALMANGLAGQLPDFVRASARFQLTQYQAEHEAMLRTRGYAGYQLLMLNDFTGQSEALVGILDPFWESKGIVSAAEVRAWNAPTVLLARFPKFVWTADERFTARIELAHFGASNLPAETVDWRVQDAGGPSRVQGQFHSPAVTVGSVIDLGVIRMPLDGVPAPSALTLTVRRGDAVNRWNLWVYPPGAAEPDPPEVLMTRALDAAALAVLNSGGKVLLLAAGIKNPFTARTGFESVYWSAGWWGNRFSSLGLLCDPGHPALKEFPNQGWSDWQWRELCQGATTFDLTGAPSGFRPIVQLVPDFHFNTLLGQLFEGRLGNGLLLVCGYDLTGDLDQRPAARQFRRSLFHYAASERFRPTTALPSVWIEERLRTGGLAGRGAAVIQVGSEDHAHGNLAANILDGDPATFWHTRWQPHHDAPPHELVVDLGRELTISGVTCLPRQDQSNGRIARADLYVSRRADRWGEPAALIRGTDTADLVTLRFSQPLIARFLRLVVNSEVREQPFAALAELDVIQANGGSQSR
ncbi:MAG: discoidin domain-containing protein [Verrucomicrobia bacterium]|nr:discoidin domain-containing protein [Verrucomicrobiota bacterium]